MHIYICICMYVYIYIYCIYIYIYNISLIQRSKTPKQVPEVPATVEAAVEDLHSRLLVP